MQFSTDTPRELELAEYQLRSGPLDLVIDALESLAKNTEIPEELRKKLNAQADRLRDALGVLDEVEEEFLNLLGLA